MSSFWASVSRRNFKRSVKKSLRRRKAVIASSVRKRPESEEKIRMPSNRKSILSIVSKKRWRWNANSSKKRGGRRRSIFKRC